MTNHQVEAEALDALARKHVERAARRARLIDNDQCDHCAGPLRGSDHCPCCGCEQFEAICDHICDGASCTIDH